MTYNRHQSALQAAQTKLSQDYGLALALYRTPEREPTEQEIRSVLIEVKKLNLMQTSKVLDSVLDKLAHSSTQKSSCGCGCNGKNADSAGKCSTKSMSNSTTRQNKSRENHFAKHFERMACESQDAAYEAFMTKCDAYLK